MQWSWMRCFVVCVALGATPALAQSQLQLQQQMKGGGENARPPLPLHINLSLTESVGSGTFVVSPWNPTVASTLTLTPIVAWQGFTFLLNQSFGLEHTSSDTTTSPQVEISDLSMLGRYMRWSLADGAILLLPTVGYQVPLSMFSRETGSLGTGIGGLRAILNLGEYGISLYSATNAGFSFLVPSLAHRFRLQKALPVNDRVLGAITPVTCNPRNQLELSNYGCSDGQLPAQWRWGTGVGGAWFGFDGAVSVNVDLNYGQSFSVFLGPDDARKADAAVAGLVPRQTTSGNISVSLIPLPWLFFTLGANSFQGAWTADGKTIRFPFWDFVSPYNNFSQIYLDTTISL
jgi:hypothetical protein